jgi:membrane-associated protease RseP (regulator of RpoE activity)
MIMNILMVVLGIASVIGIHEASHMLVSKFFGIKVLKFSLGFGPILLSKTINETSYELRLLPLGGFVSCAGEDPEMNVERGFFSVSWWKRSLIALAGPVANLILGFVMIFVLLVLFKGWPILQGLGRAYTISSMAITETLKALGGMIGHTVPASQLSGPIMVTKLLASSVKEGIAQFLFVLAIISLSLGLFNLVPCPGLDGGHVILYFGEFLYGRKFSTKVYIMWSYIGILLLVSLMLFTCYLDIVKLLH